MTILEENHHSLIFIEHDPLLYEDAAEMTEYVSQAMREAAKKATVLLYSPETDQFLEELIKMLTACSTSTKGRELRQGLLLKLIHERRRARPHWRHSHKATMWA